MMKFHVKMLLVMVLALAVGVWPSEGGSCAKELVLGSSQLHGILASSAAAANSNSKLFSYSDARAASGPITALKVYWQPGGCINGISLSYGTAAAKTLGTASGMLSKQLQLAAGQTITSAQLRATDRCIIWLQLSTSNKIMTSRASFGTALPTVAVQTIVAPASS